MWSADQSLRIEFDKISLAEERGLITRAQAGSLECTQELVLRHVDFVGFRLRRKVTPALLRRFGDDMLSEGILILHEKVRTYDLGYRDKAGQGKPVRFSTYIWKRIDGFIIDYLVARFRDDGWWRNPTRKQLAASVTRAQATIESQGRAPVATARAASGSLWPDRRGDRM
jgi:DNA-directed RNA polymerase specialized sigma subunit